MGIPHLITYLQPYAKPKALKGENFVIDGPGLAYHIHHLCLKLRPGARNPFDAAPSYKELGEATIVWLDELEARGAIVQKIFFDGFLPLAKYPTRTKRLSGYTKQLIDYHALHSGTVPSARVEVIEDISSSSLFVEASANPSHSKISAPPFLVSAILDALFRDERYSGIVTVVPGEADLYCAQFLRNHGGTVVSGDSDLLVHDLGSDGAVAFLKDIDFVDASSIQFVQYQPAEIAQRLGLDPAYSLRALAFELVIDSQKTFRQLLQRAIESTSIKEHKSLYDTFIAEYQPLEITKLSEPLNKDLDNALSKLDPRISEYIRQFKIFDAGLNASVPVTCSSTRSREDFDIFLPFLIDCPTRTSAWESSTHIRQLAYGLVNLVAPKDEQLSAIVEHRRQQRGSRGRSWQIPLGDEIIEASQSLLSDIQGLRSILGDIPAADFWRAASLYQDIAWAQSNNKAALSEEVILSKVKGVHLKLTWDAIHFCGQMHGTHYSFRILKQILGVVTSHAKQRDLPSSVIRLQAALEDLPGIYVLSSIREESEVLSGGHDLARVSAIKGMLKVDDAEPSVLLVQTAKSESKKKRKRSKSGSNTDAVAKKSTNPFDLLGDM